jgi:hypothetical protein
LIVPNHWSRVQKPTSAWRRSWPTDGASTNQKLGRMTWEVVFFSQRRRTTASQHPRRCSAGPHGRNGQCVRRRLFV